MKRIDLLLKRAEQFEKLAVYGDRKSFLKALSQSQTEPLAVHTEPTNYVPKAAPEPVTDVNLGLGYESEVKPGPNGVRKMIDSKVQKQLNELLVPKGKIFVLDTDGKLGDKTIEAAIQFTREYKMPATPENINKVYYEQKFQSSLK